MDKDVLKQMIREKCQGLVDVLVDSIGGIYEDVYSKLPDTMSTDQKKDTILQAMDMHFNTLKKQFKDMAKIRVNEGDKNE